MIIGIDIGNHTVNTSTGNSFLAKISEVPDFEENSKVIIDGKDWYAEEGEFSTDWNKADKSNLIELLYYALAQEKGNMFKIVLGLPAGQYKVDKTRLEERIKANNFKRINYKGKTRDILITDVIIAPEGAAAYYSLSEEHKKKIADKQLIIVDIGGRTTDIILFKDFKIKKVDTIEVGTSNIYQEAIKEINKTYRTNFKLEDGERIIKNGLMINGEVKDIAFIQPILKRNFDSIYKSLQLFGNITDGYIMLTGGGSLLLQKPFKNRLNNIIMTDKPQWDNVNGFKVLGDNKYE